MEERPPDLPVELPPRSHSIHVEYSLVLCRGQEKLLSGRQKSAVPVRAVHRLSEDKRWESEFVSQVRCIPWDFKCNAGEGIEYGVIPEGTDKSDPAHLVGPPPRMRMRRMCSRRADEKMSGFSESCNTR